MCHPDDRADGEVIVAHVNAFGHVARLALTPGVVLWQLEAAAGSITAVIIDADRRLSDRLELLTYLQESFPHVKRVLLVTSPSNKELEGWNVLDKQLGPETLSSILALVG